MDSKREKEVCKRCGQHKVIRIHHDPFLGNWQEILCPKCDSSDEQQSERDEVYIANIANVIGL